VVGVAGFASQIPVLFLATVGGTVADRFNRHRILVVTQTSSMVLPLLLAALVFTGVVPGTVTVTSLVRTVLFGPVTVNV
jgi:nitrate/nitrite transporter NarK